MTNNIKGTFRRLEVEELSEEDAIVAVIGPSGAGKSSFINTATGSREPVNDLESCTRNIGIIKFFPLDKRKPDVVLVDTPGFNHEQMTNAEVLEVIAGWLKATYDRNVKLTGILYFQHLGPMTSAHRRDNMMIERMCGKKALQNTVFTTTIWNKIDPALEFEWEDKLVKGWEAIIGPGSMSMRYRNTVDSAWDILDNLLQRKDRHALRLQTEMVDLGLQLHETVAGPSWDVHLRLAARPTLTAMKLMYENLTKSKEAIMRSSLSVNKMTAVVQVDELSPDDVVIALMGPTGAGKSSFINMATGNDLVVGHDLESCTTKVRMVKVHDIILVDTPGFDDTCKTDTEILQIIADWLEKTYKRDIMLAGILYFHRISDNRVAGTPLKNLRIFEKLCGKKALPNVILMTTMWDKVDPVTATKREDDLKNGYWKGMIKRGSKTVRYRNTSDSAWDILDIFVRDRRLAVLLQKEMVDMERQLRETDAGQELYKELEAMVKQLTERLEKVQVATKDDEYNLNAQLQTMIAGMQTLKISMGRRFLRYVTSPLKPLY